MPLRWGKFWAFWRVLRPSPARGRGDLSAPPPSRRRPAGRPVAEPAQGWGRPPRASPEESLPLRSARGVRPGACSGREGAGGAAPALGRPRFPRGAEVPVFSVSGSLLWEGGGRWPVGSSPVGAGSRRPSPPASRGVRDVGRSP